MCLAGEDASRPCRSSMKRPKGLLRLTGTGAYNWLEARRRQVCWAHLARDFQAFVERGGESEKVGKSLLSQVKRLFKVWHKARSGKLSPEEFEEAMKPIEQNVKKSLETGNRLAHEKA